MIQGIKMHLERRFAEWAVAIGLFCWGFILLNNPENFNNANFSGMRNLAAYYIWGWAAVLLGVLRLSFLTINGMWKKSAHLRLIGSSMSTCIWASIWVSYLGASLSLTHILPNLATIGVLIALDFYAVWLTAEDAKYSDRK